MPKKVKGLSITQVKNTKPESREYNLADGDGLYLRVKPNGTKIWIFNYQKPFTKKRSNISIGIFPSIMLAKARSERNKYRELLAQNIDPRDHRTAYNEEQEEAHTNTLKLVTENWFKVKSSELTEDYAKDIYNSLQNHIFPYLGNKPLHQITAPETIGVLEPLADANKLELVRRICQRLNMVMDYAVNTGIILSNPLSGIRKAFRTPTKRNLPTIKPKELPALMKAVENANVTMNTRLMLQWQLHTMVRPSEAAGAKWDEINFDKFEWEIPAERMKKKRPLTIPLSRQAMNILEQLKPISGHREHVFPSSRSPKRSANPESVNMALKRMGFKNKLVSHGLRALASTTLNEQGFDPNVIEAALAHIDPNETRAAYNRAEYLERRKTMMQWWSDHIEHQHHLAQPKLNYLEIPEKAHQHQRPGLV